MAKITGSGARMLLLELHAREFDWKPLVARSQFLSGKECRAGIVEAPDLGKRAAVFELEVHTLVRHTFQFVDDVGPALLGGELLDAMCQGLLRLGRGTRLAKTDVSAEKENRQRDYFPEF